MGTRLLAKPGSDFVRFFDVMDRLFDGVRPMGTAWASNGEIPLEIYEREGTLYVQAAVPGVAPENLDVSVDGNVLTISGHSTQEWESDESAKVYRREYRYGSFSRSVRLPEGLDLDRISARTENGTVRISLPKLVAPESAVRKVPIESGHMQPELEASKN